MLDLGQRSSRSRRGALPLGLSQQFAWIHASCIGIRRQFFAKERLHAMQGLSVIQSSFPSWCLRRDSNSHCIISETIPSANWGTKANDILNSRRLGLPSGKNNATVTTIPFMPGRTRKLLPKISTANVKIAGAFCAAISDSR